MTGWRWRQSWRPAGTREETALYIDAACEAIDRALDDRTDRTITRWLTPVCPECGRMPVETEAGTHVTYGDFVVVGCEGYWVISPAAVGIERPRWDDWRSAPAR